MTIQTEIAAPKLNWCTFARHSLGGWAMIGYFSGFKNGRVEAQKWADSQKNGNGDMLECCVILIPSDEVMAVKGSRCTDRELTLLDGLVSA